jgi:hypothetical protein
MGRHALLLLALLAAIYSPVWLAGKTLMPWTGAVQAEWAADAPRPLTRTALDTADSVLLLVPWDVYSLNCVMKGEWPWWNPYQGLGHPHWENIVTTGLSPGMWMEAALPAGLKEFVWLGQLWVAAIFTMMLGRALGLGWPGTLLAGVAVITSPHFELYMTQRHMSGTAMWWPLALWGVECLRRSFPGVAENDPGTAPESRLPGFCGVAAGTWGLLTGGNPSITLAGGAGLFLYALVRIPWGSGVRSVLKCAGWLALAGISGMAIAAPAWVNFFPWLASCYSRMDDPIFLEGGQAGRVVFTPGHLGTMLLPYVYGQTMEYPFGRIPRWLWSAFGGWYSAAVVFLSAAGVWRAWKQKGAGLRLLGFMAFGVIARSYGAPGTEWVAGLPFWKDVSFTRYATFIPVFGLALLAGFGIEAITGPASVAAKRLMSDKRARLAVAGTWLVLMTITLLLAFGNLPDIGKWSEKAAGQWKHFAWLGLFWTIVPVFALLWLAGKTEGQLPGDDLSHDAARLTWPAVMGLALAAEVFVPWGYSPLTHSVLGIVGGAALLAATVCARHFRPEKWLRGGGESGRAVVPRGTVLAGMLAVIAALPLCVSLWAPNGLPPKFDPIPKGGLVQALSRLQSANYSRSWSMDGLPMPNHAMPSGIFSLNVIDGLITREEAAYAGKHLDPHCPPTWLAGNAAFKRAPGETALEAYLSRRKFYQFASVRYVTSLAALPGLHPLLRDESGMILWEDNDALPRARLVASDVAAMPPADAVHHKPDVATGGAEIQSFTPNAVKIRATNSEPCILVLADAPKAGWSVRIDGHPAEMLTAHGCFRAVALPRAGTWEVEMRYRPPWWNFSWMVAGAGLLCFAFPCFWLSRSRRWAAISENSRA